MSQDPERKVVETTISTPNTSTLNDEDIDFSVVDALPPQQSSSSDTTEKDDEEEVDEKSKVKKSKKSKKKDDKKPDTIPMSQMFKYATPLDKFYMIVGSISAIGNGIAFPLMTIIFAGFIDAFARFSLAMSIYNISDKSAESNGAFDVAKNALDDDIRKYVIYFLILGSSIFLLAYFQMALWTITGENQANVIIFIKNFFFFL